jgi:hypothetical protein
MNNLRAAAQQALEALEYIHTETTAEEDKLIHTAITALRSALAQQEQADTNWLKARPHVEQFINSLGYDMTITDERVRFEAREKVDVRAQQKQENLTRQMPEWMDYDPATDVLTIHGRRYSAAMFGEQGFLSPVGTLLQVAEGQPDCITLTTVPLGQQGQEQEPVAHYYAKHLAIAIWEKHYKVVAPDWRPLPDLMGVLTQIDNMAVGLAPPRRAWQGLTEEEIYPLYSEPSSDAEMVEFARAIEAALRSKNYE